MTADQWVSVGGFGVMCFVAGFVARAVYEDWKNNHGKKADS